MARVPVKNGNGSRTASTSKYDAHHNVLSQTYGAFADLRRELSDSKTAVAGREEILRNFAVCPDSQRAWLLLEDLNTSFQQPVAEMSVGGRGGGGASLTAFGTELVAAYRSLEAQIQKRAQTAFPPTALPAAGDAYSRKAVPKRRVNRPTAGASRPRTKR